MLLSDFSIKRPVPTIVIILMLMVLGLMALKNLRVNQIPDVEQPVLVVNIPYPGASPETVEREIIIDRAVALQQKDLGLDKLKLIVLMVLWSQHEDLDPMIIEDLLTPVDASQAH